MIASPAAERDTALQILGNCTSYTRKIHTFENGSKAPSTTQLVEENESAVGMSLAVSSTSKSFL
jgi:hypothetical protein